MNERIKLRKEEMCGDILIVAFIARSGRAGWEFHEPDPRKKQYRKKLKRWVRGQGMGINASAAVHALRGAVPLVYLPHYHRAAEMIEELAAST